jgi:hypothetical protein
MTPERQQELYERWPEIFRERTLDQTKTGMCWGVDCDDRWASIIDALCQTLMLHAQNGPHLVPAAKALKEKLGTLRLQLDLQFRCEFCEGAIEMARSMSERIPTAPSSEAPLAAGK